MSVRGMSNGAEQWCPVKGGGCIWEMSFNRGSTVVRMSLDTFTCAVLYYMCVYIKCQSWFTPAVLLVSR